MKKIILAGVLGGIVLTVWGRVAWMALPIHDASMNKIEDEDAVVGMLNSSLTKHGVYAFPTFIEETNTMTEEEIEAMTNEYAERYKRGPVGIIVFQPEGSDPLIQQMIYGVLISILAALLAAWMLSRSTAMQSSYWGRISFCGMLGILASLVTHAMYWNWMHFPFDYTTAMILDTVIGWVLAGFVIGAIVKPEKMEG